MTGFKSTCKKIALIAATSAALLAASSAQAYVDKSAELNAINIQIGNQQLWVNYCSTHQTDCYWQIDWWVYEQADLDLLEALKQEWWEVYNSQWDA